MLYLIGPQTKTNETTYCFDDCAVSLMMCAVSLGASAQSTITYPNSTMMPRRVSVTSCWSVTHAEGIPYLQVRFKIVVSVFASLSWATFEYPEP